MRTYGRTRDVLTGVKTWHTVTTDADGFNDSVWLTTLAQVCKLNLGESPFFADYGIPAHPSVVLQVYPDFYMARIQDQFAPYFASLLLTLTPVTQGSADSDYGRPYPAYNINVLTNHCSSIGIQTRPNYPMDQPI